MLNNQIFYFFYNLTHQNIVFDWLIVFFAVYFPYIVVIIAGFFLLFHHEVLKAEEPFQVFMEKKKEILLAFFSGILAWILAYGLKFMFSMPRPFDILPQIFPLVSKTGYTFPSGHATFYMALAFSIFFLHKKAGYFFIFFALIIGIARIVAGVHFPADILGGFILGVIVAYVIRKIS